MVQMTSMAGLSVVSRRFVTHQVGQRMEHRMRARLLAVAGVGAASLFVAAAFASGASAASSVGSESANAIPVALAMTSHGAISRRTTPKASLKGKCKTKLGTELASPDGVISWNDTTADGFDMAGAADFTCGKSTAIKKVWVYGYGGTAQDLFNVVFYADSGPDALDEPLDSSVLCSYANVPAAAGGVYPTRVLTKLRLPTACTIPTGTWWVSVQNENLHDPWYWEMQQEQRGFAPDWRDVNNVYKSGCTTYDGNPAGTPGNGGDTYLVGCLRYDYGDWMFVLR
jgi:hypothetical protein